MTAQLMDRSAPAGSVGVPMIRVASTGTRAMGIAETAVLATVTPRTAEAFQVQAAITDLVAGVLILSALAISPGPESMFYGTTAGTGSAGNDYAATVAVNTPVPFPRAGPATPGSGIVAGGANQFVLPVTGLYEVSWAVDFLEPSQLVVKLGAVEQAHTCTTSGAGIQQNTNTVIVSATAGDLLSLCNASGNAAALTVQQADGNLTHAQAPSLVIKQLTPAAVDGVAVWTRTKANGDVEVVALGGSVARTVRWTLIGVA